MENSDPRYVAKADASVLAALKMFQMDKATPPSGISMEATREEKLAFGAGMETMFEPLMAGLGHPSPLPGVTTETVTIKGVDNNDIDLYISKSDAGESATPRPCVLHIHGGGMAVLSATAQVYVATREKIASLGLIVVGVEFRNAAGALGPHPFPAGLNDCMSALQWVNDNKADMGISKVIVSGESGGGNLSCAVALLAKRDSKLDQLDGVYAFCPYICGMWRNPDAPEALALQSVEENDGLFLALDDMRALASIYLPDGVDPRSEPLAWPFWASPEDLQGLPPHVISVNELDPLRDEGIEYYRKLSAAGVSARAKVVLGTPHAGDLIFMKFAPSLFESSLADLVLFANSL